MAQTWLLFDSIMFQSANFLFTRVSLDHTATGKTFVQELLQSSKSLKINES